MSPIALVVEDDADLRLLATLRLRKLGWSAVEAASLEQAKELLSARDDLDAILLDLRLGPADGAELLDWLGETGRRPRPGVIVVSANADPETAARTLGRGASAYVKKPYSATELSDALERATGA